MELIPAYIDELIVRSLAKSATTEELAALTEWINLSQKNAAYFKQMKFIFETSEQIKKNVPVNVDQAWNKVSKTIGGNNTLSIHSGKTNKFRFLQIAASIALICILGITVYYITGTEKQNTLLSLETHEKSIHQKLDDGSLITLETNSNLTALHQNKREYKFSGKGKFNVKHNSKNPFILHANNLLIKDIGTIFTVDADPQKDVIHVEVSEGIVHIYTKEQKGIILKQGQTGNYYKSMDVFEKIEPLPDTMHQLATMNFENTELIKVIAAMETKFNTKIEFANEAIKHCRITVKFNHAGLNEILDIISETLDVWTSEEKGKIIIGGKGC